MLRWQMVCVSLDDYVVNTKRCYLWLGHSLISPSYQVREAFDLRSLLRPLKDAFSVSSER